jgi:Tol biopolymer transport system component
MVRLGIGALGLVACGAPAGLRAQYFGQNQVIYHTFDFREMHTPHFDIYFYPAESLATADAARMAERWYARHAATLRDTFPRKPIVFYADFAAFQQNNIVQGIGQGTGGVTEPIRSRAILPFNGEYAENDHVLGHELVHVFQFDIANAQKGPGLAAMDRLPQWLIEGMAEYMSIGRNDVNTAMWLRDAALRNDLPTIRQLGRDFRYFPYRYGESLWAYIGGRWGDEVIPSLYRAALRGGLDPAVRTVLGISTDSLSKAWRAAIMSQYLPTMAGRVRPEVVGTRLLKPFGKYGDFDVSPVLSPDGKRVAFYTQRGVFEIDLYIANATTGRIVRRLTSPNRDLHFDALNFINSAGAWSPDGRKLAVPVFKEGRNEINIYDVASGHIDRTITLDNVFGINDVAWGPHGQMLIAGQHGGLVDLFLYDLHSGTSEQLTRSRYAKLQPTWSPDGRYVAFATDSGPGTNFDSLTYAPMRIALMDMQSRTTQLLPLFTGAKHISPQFSPDGRQLYFVSDRGGFDDIFRVTLATGDVVQLTNLATGVSGITSLSPTLSVAAVSGRMMFTVFEHGGYALHRIEPEDRPGIAVAASDTAGTSAQAAAGIMPPPDVPGGGAVTVRIANATAGLPSAATTFPTGIYHRAFALEQVGGGVAVGVGGGGGGGYYGGYGFGAGAYGAGGITAVFGDVLENNQFIASAGGAGDIQDFGGSVTYINLSHRWNYGATLSHTPQLIGFTNLFDSAGTQRLDYVRQRVYDEGAQLFVQYPFSPVHRVEFTAGYDYIHFQIERDAYGVDASGTSFTLLQQGQHVQAPPGISLASVGAAFVGDYSTFGLTSPIAGARYRFGVMESGGNLQFTTVTADYRHYILVNPVTFAFRAIHYGRYGKDADSPQFYPFYLGDPYLDFVRGYDPNSFKPAECPVTGTACPSFDRLIGSKVAAANIELRIPVLGVSQYGLINFPYLPTEVAPFIDAGVAWANGSPPTFRLAENSLAREPVISSGVSIRINLLGYLVGEVYAAYPWMRPGAGWQYGFQLLPGW